MIVTPISLAGASLPPALQMARGVQDAFRSDAGWQGAFPTRGALAWAVGPHQVRVPPRSTVVRLINQAVCKSVNLNTIKLTSLLKPADDWEVRRETGSEGTRGGMKNRGQLSVWQWLGKQTDHWDGYINRRAEASSEVGGLAHSKGLVGSHLEPRAPPQASFPFPCPRRN